MFNFILYSNVVLAILLVHYIPKNPKTKQDGTKRETRGAFWTGKTELSSLRFHKGFVKMHTYTKTCKYAHAWAHNAQILPPGVLSCVPNLALPLSLCLFISVLITLSISPLLVLLFEVLLFTKAGLGLWNEEGEERRKNADERKESS